MSLIPSQTGNIVLVPIQKFSLKIMVAVATFDTEKRISMRLRIGTITGTKSMHWFYKYSKFISIIQNEFLCRMVHDDILWRKPPQQKWRTSVVESVFRNAGPSLWNFFKRGKPPLGIIQYISASSFSHPSATNLRFLFVRAVLDLVMSGAA